jgi:glycosyltransferase involved in cell wall biosynthesis
MHCVKKHGEHMDRLRVGVFIAQGSLGGPIMGRTAVSLTFLQALQQHPDVDLTVYLDGALPGFLRAAGITAKPTSMLPDELPGQQALHDLTSGYFVQLAELRNTLAPQVAVTWQLHSMTAPPTWPLYTHPALGIQDAAFVSSKPLAQVFEKIAPSSRTEFQRPVIPLGVPDALAAPVGRLAQVEKAIGRRSNTTVVMTLGRFSVESKQDLEPVRAALEILRQRDPGRDFVHLAAGASQGRDYEALVARWPRTVVVPNFDEADKAALFASADVFLAPSTSAQESFSLAPVEAMVCGVPVVATEFSGHRDTVTADAGVLVPVKPCALGDLRHAAIMPAQDYLWQVANIVTARPEDYADAVEKVTARHATYAAGARARGAEYLWSRVIEQYLNVWRRAPCWRPKSSVPLDHAGIFAPLWWV